jgi:hypothetical protein
MQREKIFKIRTTYQRMESAKSRKDQIEMEKMKKNVFLLQRMDILKEKRQEMREDAIRRRMEHQRKFEWVRYILTCQAAKHIFNVFD